MQIVLENLGKKFGKEWIFRNLSFIFEEGKTYAITGKNGSGKTTLLKIIAAILQAEKGQVHYTHNGKTINESEIYHFLSYSGPYTGLIEGYTLEEVIQFHQKFKPLQLSTDDLIEEMGLSKAKNRLVMNFSSGMRQKLKLGLAFFSYNSLLLLDEPTSNLDKENTAWYRQHAELVAKQKMLIICSNQPYEYDFCDEVLQLGDFQE